jgi:hypothetical protein
MARARASVGLLILLLLLMLVLLGPELASARTVGVAENDSVTYDYTIHTTYATPNGNNTTDQHNRLTLDILSVEPQAPLGEVVYTETITLLNNTAVSGSQPAENVTTIFDPYNNDTYLGNIGFYPFTYTDLAAGSVKGLKLFVNVTGTGTSPGYVSSTQTINASVYRTPNLIDVNFTILAAPHLPISLTALEFNSTTGLLMRGVTYTHFFGIEKDFIYDLVGYAIAPPVRPGYSDYLILGIVVAAVAVVALVAYVKRPSPRERKAERIRKRLGSTIVLRTERS